MKRSDYERMAAELCRDLILQANDEELRRMVRKLAYYRANKEFGGTSVQGRF